MPDKRIMFVQRLYERTINGAVSWERTSDEGVYQAAFPNYGIRIFSRYNRNAESDDYSVSIFNNEGVLIETISDDDLHALDHEAGIYKMMADTYETARRTAMGVEQALDELLGDLDDGLPF